jgi:uncharacterized membrane protein
MDSSLWMKLHGATTHFPIALVMASMLLDLAGFLLPDNPDKSRRGGFRSAGFYTLILASLGAVGAVISGLVMTHGKIWGRGDLARHHAFLWPALGLLLALAVWRLVVGNHASSRSLRIYLAVSMVTAALMSAAGYWGGELLLNG